jgi:hypothetical protein
MKLALALGKTRRELLTGVPGMDSEEVTLWMAMDRVDPFGQERADLRAGIVAANYSNWKRSPDQDRYVPDDYMWKYDGTKGEAQTPEEVDQAIDSAFGALAKGAESVGSGKDHSRFGDEDPRMDEGTGDSLERDRLMVEGHQV